MTIDDSLRSPASWATEDQVPADWAPGDVFLELYEVVALLGEGGMGKVWRVHHRAWGLDMAVKSPRPEYLTTDEGRDMFGREAQTWVNLDLHPHTVSCYYVRSLGGIPRVFAEFVDGGTLQEAVWHGRLYEGDPAGIVPLILDIGIQTAWGLQHAHHAGLLHQDVKSANILVTSGGIAKVTDFGLAMALDSTHQHGLMTPQYASPEQIAGEPLTARSDIYSWAVVMLEMLTQATPQEGEDKAAVLQHLRAQQAKEQVSLVLPASFLQLLARCLADDPAIRPDAITDVVPILTQAYEATAHRPYPRSAPSPTERHVDSLNNRAVSLVDLGQLDAAMALLTEATARGPGHLHAAHNLALLQWRTGQITEARMLDCMRQIRAANPPGWEAPYLQAWVHLERGDFAAVEAALTDADRLASHDEGVRQVLQQVQAVASLGSHEVHRLAAVQGDVYATAITPDGNLVVSGGSDGVVRTWDPITGACLSAMAGHTSPVAGLCLTPDGQVAFSASADTTIRMWNLATGQCLGVFVHGWSTRHVAVSDDGTWLIVASMDKTLSCWHVPTSRRVRTLQGHGEAVLGVAMTGDGSLAVSASEDTTLRIWDLSTGGCLGILEGHSGPVQAVALFPDGRWCVSASADRTLRLWNLETLQSPLVFTGHRGVVKSVAIAVDARLAISGASMGNHADAEDSVRLWDLSTGRCIGVLQGHRASAMSVGLSADGVIASAAHAGGHVGLWAVHPLVAPLSLVQPRKSEDVLAEQNQFKAHLQALEDAVAEGAWRNAVTHLQTARSLPSYATSPQLAALGTRLHDRASHGDLHGVRSVAVLNGHEGAIRRVVLAPDGKTVISNGKEGTVRVWDAATETLARKLSCAHPDTPRMYGLANQSAPPEAGYGLALSPDGTLLLSVGAEHAVKVWETATGKAVRSLAGHTDSVSCVVVTPDNRLAASGSVDGSVRVWSLASGKCLQTLMAGQGGIYAVDLSPDGCVAVSAHTDARVRVWDVPGNRVVSQVEGMGELITSVLLSHDQRFAITAGLKRSIRIWNLESSQCLQTLQGHTGGIYSLALSADDHFLLSASDDRLLKLWDLREGRCLQTLDGPGGAVTTCAMTPNARYVACGGDDRTVRIWELDWNLVPPPDTPFDEAARPVLKAFLDLHARPAGLLRKASPTWTDAERDFLMVQLGWSGLGWLKTDMVDRELKKMAQTWSGTVPYGA
ncbi:MAG TPA: protein kinase [Candidatus Xenobia bacterium]